MINLDFFFVFNIDISLFQIFLVVGYDLIIIFKISSRYNNLEPDWKTNL